MMELAKKSAIVSSGPDANDVFPDPDQRDFLGLIGGLQITT